MNDIRFRVYAYEQEEVINCFVSFCPHNVTHTVHDGNRNLNKPYLGCCANHVTLAKSCLLDRIMSRKVYGYLEIDLMKELQCL